MLGNAVPYLLLCTGSQRLHRIGADEVRDLVELVPKFLSDPGRGTVDPPTDSAISEPQRVHKIAGEVRNRLAIETVSKTAVRESGGGTVDPPLELTTTQAPRLSSLTIDGEARFPDDLPNLADSDSGSCIMDTPADSTTIRLLSPS